MFWSAGCSLLRAEGFSCSLGVLYGGLRIGKLLFLIQKKLIFFPAVIFFNFRSSKPGSRSRIRIRNPDPQLEKILDPGSVSGSALNQCGSETLWTYDHLCLCITIYFFVVSSCYGSHPVLHKFFMHQKEIRFVQSGMRTAVPATGPSDRHSSPGQGMFIVVHSSLS